MCAHEPRQNVTKIIVPYVVGHLPCPYECGRSFKHATQRILHVRKVHTVRSPTSPTCLVHMCGFSAKGGEWIKFHILVDKAFDQYPIPV